MIRTPFYAVYHKLPGILPGALVLALIASTAFAGGVDMTIFGPKRYDRPKGAPASYADTFERCEPSDRALVRVTNGSGKSSSITAGKILVNGSAVFSESDFKNQIPLLEREITINRTNQLAVELKSGGPDTPFVIIEIIGRGCDSTPPSIFSPAPADGSLLNTAIPPISAGYADDAKGSGIDSASIRLIVDGADRTASATIGGSGVSFNPSPLPEGGHNVTVSVADRAANASSLTWSFTTDTIAPVVRITSHADGAFINTPVIELAGSLDDRTARVSANAVGGEATTDGFRVSGFTLAEGANTIRVTATDPATNSGSHQILLNLDTAAPRLRFDSPAEGAYLATPRLSVRGSVDEPLLRALVNGTAAELSPGAVSVSEIVLAEGVNTLVMEGWDRAGNRGSATRSVTVDTILPVIAVSSPADGVWLNTPDIAISGRVTDTNLGRLTVNGVTVPTDGGSFTHPVRLSEGVNSFTLRAEDLAGNFSEQLFTVQLDTAPPLVTITSPADGVFLNTPQISVTGTVNEPVTSVTVSGVPAIATWDSSTSTSTFTCTLVLVEGANSITVNAVDRAGNGGTASVPANLDTVPPAVAIQSPSAGFLTNVPTAVVTGTVSEPHVTVSVNGVAATVEGAVFTATVPLAEGDNTLTATASDRAGNSGSGAVSGTLDTIPPAPPALASQKSPTNVAATALSGTAEANASVKISNGGALIGTVSAADQGSFTLPGVTLAEGTNSFTATATDAAGNESAVSQPLAVVLDTKPPVVKITSQTSGQYLNTPTVTVSGTLDDSTALVTVNGASAQVTAGGFTIAGVALAEGANTISVEALDPAGNPASDSITLNLDTAPPVVTVSAPVANAFLNIPQIIVTGTINEPVTAVTVNGVSATVNGQSFSASIMLAEGVNSVSVTATDRASNEGSAVHPLNLDTVPPAVTITTPASGLLTKTAQVTVTGQVSEEFATVTVNNLPAAVTGKSFTLDSTLSEGENTLVVKATDRATNAGSASVNVALDSTAPAPPTLAQRKTPTNMAATSISGAAEANSTVKISVAGAVIGTLTADAQGSFTLADVTLAEGANSFTATAADAAGNESLPSAPLNIVLDTQPPVITVASPSESQFFSAPQVSVKGSIDEAVASLTINGQTATMNSTDFDHPLTLTPGLNSITLAATDLAGNSATKTVLVTLDSTPPVVTITAPVSGGITKNAQVTVTGAISKPNTTATVNGAPITVTDQAFTFIYNLNEGENTITVEATDRAGNKGSAAVTVTLDSQAPALSLQALPEAAAGANVTVGVTASDNRSLTLVELKADGVPIWSGGSAPSVSEAVSYRLSPSLNAGSEVVFQARGTDAAGNEGTATATIRITQAATGPGYIQGKALDDLRGLRMEGATVAITDAKGETKSLTTAVDGGYFQEVPAGSALVKISRPGYTTVERLVTILPEKKATALDARLTKISDTKNVIDAAGGTATALLLTSNVSPLTIELSVPANALSAQTDIRLTPVSNQGLAGVLPLGWSPLAVADIRLLDPTAGTPLDATLASAATLKFPLSNSIAGQGDPAPALILTSYDAVAHRWTARGVATLAADGLSASAEITAAGEYALVIGDPAPDAQPALVAGVPLPPAAPVALAYDAVAAAGKVVPQASPPSTGLKAAGEVVITAKEGTSPTFTSGLVLSSRITENFDLKSGDKVESPAYSQDIILYRYPCITNIGAGALTALSAANLRTTFPVSPSKDYTIAELLLGKVGLEITAPDLTDSGVMVGTDGGRLADADGNILAIPQGALSQTTPVSTKNGVAATGAVGDDFTLIKVVEVNFTRQTLAQGATLSIPVPAGVDPNLTLIVARQIEVKGVARLKLVALARQSGSLIGSDTAAPGITLPGITTSGAYYFLQAKGPIGYLAGTVTNAANSAFTGAFVKTDKGSLVDLTPATGRYLLALPVTSFTATAVDLYKNDEGSASGAINAANQAVTLDLKILMIPPTVVSISPAANATNVQPNVPVVVTFSKSIDQSSISSATLKLANPDGSAVAGVFTFSVDGKTVTFTPSELLISEKSYTLTIGAGIKDLQGYTLGSDATAAFTVRKTTPPPPPPAGSITATFPDSDGFVTITGTQGSADPKDTVLIINDASGEIVSVKPAENGSFTAKVRAQLGEEIKVVLMDYSGNQTLVSYITYKSDDGKYLVTAKGGKVEGEGGSVLEIPEGALVGPTVVKITQVLQESLPHPVPEGGKFLGALNLDSGGMNFQKEVHLSIPVPDGFPADAVPFLAKPTELVNADGSIEKVYEVIDSTKIINGRITTASPPFDGVMGFGIFVFLYVNGPIGTDVIISGVAYQDMDGLGGYTRGVDKPIRGAVIRSPQAENFVSFTRSDGHYASYGFTAPGACRNFPLTAIHPLTMNRVTANITTCDAPYIVNNFNFKLADKDTVLPDKAAPVISLDLTVAPGQNAAFANGIIPVGTDIVVALNVKDESSGTASLTVDYRTPEASIATPYPVQLAPGQAALVTPATADHPAVWRFPYAPTFPDPIKGSQALLFRPKEAGIYRFNVEATDAAGNSATLVRQIRAFSAADIPVGVDGAPIVDGISPGGGAANIKVNAVVIATFNEPVDNVTDTTFYLLDTKTNTHVPATVTTGFDTGRMKAVLTPLGNLHYARKYEVVLTQAIHDANGNPSANGQTLPLPMEYRTSFTTKVPNAYDLAEEQFQGARDIALYRDFSEPKKIYAYVTAGLNGWRVLDVTNPALPEVVDTRNSPAGASWSYRNVAVDQSENVMAITEDIRWNDGNQFGYIRFYDLAADPAHPAVVGREKLAEAFSGIPGRVALQNNFAYVATAGLGLQVVDVTKARENQANNLSSDGSSIVGGLGTVDMGYGSPNDIFLYSQRRALLTTNPGYLLVLNIENPAIPQILGEISPGNYSFTRIVATEDFQYLDADGTIQGKDIAVAATREGMVVTVDLSDPASPGVIGQTAADTGDGPILDLAFNRETGLAFATTLGKVKIYDIRDPYHPALLETIPDGSTTTGGAPSPLALLIGPAAALVEMDGWVYLANQNTGMQTLELGSKSGMSYCPNGPCYE